MPSRRAPRLRRNAAQQIRIDVARSRHIMSHWTAAPRRLYRTGARRRGDAIPYLVTLPDAARAAGRAASFGRHLVRLDAHDLLAAELDPQPLALARPLGEQLERRTGVPVRRARIVSAYPDRKPRLYFYEGAAYIYGKPSWRT
jgi:hypothetical protein